MTQLEYLIALISIIVGLGLADLVRSLRELVRPSRVVRWHWLPFLWATVVFLIILQLWWISFDVLQADPFGRVLIFLPYLLMFLVLYLACSFALPDPNWESSPAASETDTLDLKVFYFSLGHRRWFFGALITLVILSQIINISTPALVDSVSLNLAGRLSTVGFNALFAVLLYGLIASEREWVHAAVALLVFGAVVFSLAANMSPIG